MSITPISVSKLTEKASQMTGMSLKMTEHFARERTAQCFAMKKQTHEAKTYRLL
jgi:hypothetical protein